MNREGVRVREWLFKVVEKFRQNGATSPDRAMTAQELGLPPGFQQAMTRRLGRSGIFVEVNGKYYLSEERWKQVEALRGRRAAAYGSGRRVLTLRIVQIVTAVLFVALLLVNISVQSWQIRDISIAIAIVWIVTTVLQIYFLSRVRRGIQSFQQQG